MEIMEQALAEKRGVVVLTGHVGNWEWLSASFTMNDMPVTAIAKPQPNMDYTHALDELRSKINVEIFSRGTSELLSAAKALKRVRYLVFWQIRMQDQEVLLLSFWVRQPLLLWEPPYLPRNSIPQWCQPLLSVSQMAIIG